jgi:hypothetical protein
MEYNENITICIRNIYYSNALYNIYDCEENGALNVNKASALITDIILKGNHVKLTTNNLNKDLNKIDKFGVLNLTLSELIAIYYNEKGFNEIKDTDNVWEMVKVICNGIFEGYNDNLELDIGNFLNKRLELGL